ncbi:MAG: hypothetical protein RLZZ81_749 [Pseudomonadota bacterium]|jgi:hypothetical protein
MSKGKGSDFSNLGSVGRAAEAVCLSTMGPAPLQDWQTALCAEVGRKADAAVNHKDNNHSVNIVGNVGHWGSGYTLYNPDSASNNHQD